MAPCHTSYHAECIRVGLPFTTRLKKGAGLCFPKVRHWGTFVCELCTVRDVVRRELHCATDISLLRLERMRLIDTANAWAAGTHSQYQGKLSIIREFESAHNFTVLHQPPLERPPSSIDIPLMWVQESYSPLRRSKKTNSPIAMATVRHLRSVASQFYGWEMMLQHPMATYLDQQHRVIQQPCRATDCYSYTLLTKGMSGRLGTESNQSAPLLFCHVAYMDRVFDTNFRTASSFESRRRWALAGLANLTFWLGWLRSMEVFSLTQRSSIRRPPPRSPSGSRHDPVPTLTADQDQPNHVGRCGRRVHHALWPLSGPLVPPPISLNLRHLLMAVLDGPHF